MLNGYWFSRLSPLRPSLVLNDSNTPGKLGRTPATSEYEQLACHFASPFPCDEKLVRAYLVTAIQHARRNTDALGARDPVASLNEAKCMRLWLRISR